MPDFLPQGEGTAEGGISNIPQIGWLGLLAQALAKIKSVGGQLSPLASAATRQIGEAPRILEDASYQFPPTRGTGMATQIDPGVLDVANLIPAGKIAGLAKSLMGAKAATGTGMAALAGTFLDRSALLQLAKTEPATVAKLEEARKLSEAAFAATGDRNAAWKAGSAALEGTPYAGWRPADANYPAMFEVSDQGARISDPVGRSGGLHIGPLGETYQHPELEKFLPQMRGWDSDLLQDPNTRLGGSGSFQPGAGARPPLVTASATTPEELRTVLLHEGQHGAADAFGLPQGTSPEREGAFLADQDPTMRLADIIRQAQVNYNNDPGEVLARMVENRRNLPPDIARTIPLEALIQRQLIK